MSMKKAFEFWKNLWMVKSFYYERRRVEKLRKVRETGKGGKQCNKRNGVFKTRG